MTNRAWVGSRKVAGDQKDDVVEIGIVVEAGDPRLIGRACMGGWRERQDRGDQAQTNEPVEDHGRETRSASAAPQQAYARARVFPGRPDRRLCLRFRAYFWAIDVSEKAGRSH